MAKKSNTNVKTGLAKIMAAENITVIFNPKARTASFDVVRRICTLPMLKHMDDEFVTDAFMAHEIGHALYTPYSEAQYNQLMGEIPMVFLNVTEDARIEKMIKKKYPGMVKNFFKFYKKTTSPDVDFFGLKKKNLDKITLLDKINLKFKAGVFIPNLKFSTEEQKFVDMVAAEKTFEDAIDAAKAIYEYMKQVGQVQEVNEEDCQGGGQPQPKDPNEQETMTVVKRKQKQKQEKNDEKQDENKEEKDDQKDGSSSEKEDGDGESDADKKESGGSSGQPEPGDSDDSGKEGKSSKKDQGDGEDEESTAGDKGSMDKQDGDEESGDGSPSGTCEDEKENDGEPDDGAAQGADGSDRTENTGGYNQLGSGKEGKNDKKLPDDTGFTQNNFNEAMEKQFMADDNSQSYFGDLTRYDASWKKNVSKIEIPVDEIDAQFYNAFLKKISPTVNMMATFFNMKKKASDWQKNSVQKCGKLDSKSLHKYRVAEDIFLRNEITHESKNHGIVMIIDWSGSMMGNLNYTLKQLLVLTEFCRKVQVPFEVYGFTDSGLQCQSLGYVNANEIGPAGVIEMFKLISSDMSVKDYNRHAAHIYNNVVGTFGTKSSYHNVHSSGMTPICNAAVLSEYIVAEFKRKFNREKTIFCFLSDGSETDTLKEGSKYSNISSQKDGQMVFRDSQNNKMYEHKFNKDGAPYHSIFKYMKDKCQVSSMIGFYLANGVTDGTLRDVAPNVRTKANLYQLQEKFAKDNYVEIGKDRAFDKYFIVSIGNFDVEFDNELKFGSFDTEAAKEAKIQGFLGSKTKPLLFLKKFIAEIA